MEDDGNVSMPFLDLSEIVGLECRCVTTGIVASIHTLVCVEIDNHPVMRVTLPSPLARTLPVEMKGFKGHLQWKSVYPWYLRYLPVMSLHEDEWTLIGQAGEVGKQVWLNNIDRLVFCGSKQFDFSVKGDGISVYDEEGEIAYGLFDSKYEERFIYLRRFVPSCRWLLAFLLHDLGWMSSG